ncbi:MAG: leucyl aminopeptidase family protein [Alphaproteobacteria bacterium]|nr:leucyl aminopeptidase family protein [Alphaproteobacteria bacterium]
MYYYKNHKNAYHMLIVKNDKGWDKQTKQFAKAFRFLHQHGQLMALPNDGANDDSESLRYIAGMSDASASLFDWAKFARSVPAGNQYNISNFDEFDEKTKADIILAWGLTHYRYQQFKQADKPQKKQSPQLYVPESKATRQAVQTAEAINWGRDLINHPSNYLTPSKLSHEMQQLATKHFAKFSVTDGAILRKNYPLVAAVGKAGEEKPRMLEFRWSPANNVSKKLFNLTLVGKGVCFDTGGLDLKPSKGMLMMKKDMGGAAHILVLARLIMEANLPLNLRVLIPAVENLIDKNAMRPMDIYPSRLGLNIEITNTDAEGRLILADALTAASEEKPDLIIDFATLTGAARVATGTDLPNLFSNCDNLLHAIRAHSARANDELWPMPLFDGYKKHLKSDNADMNNAPSYAYAGSITAALFLQEFLVTPIPWVHLDVMGWNLSHSPGKPRGGEIQGVRAIYQFLQDLIAKGAKINEYEDTPRTIGS